MRKAIVMALTGLLAGVLTACSGGGAAVSENEKKMKIAVLADGAGFGTQSFNDVALEGAERAAEDFGLELLKVEVKDFSDLPNSLRLLAQQNCALILTPSAGIKDAVVEVAPEYPDTKFGLLDTQIKEDYQNVASVSYREQEAAFLLGALGGYLTESDQIGFIGGISGVVQDRFQFGYEAGAKYVNPDIRVASLYAGTFSDVGKGKEIATMMYSDGCDYIAPSAGSCNLGVFQAAKEAGPGKWSFGAANGQFEQMPDKIVASQVKRVDNVAYSMIEQLVNNQFTGGRQEYGLKEGGVDLMYSPQPGMENQVSEEIRTEIEELRNQIIDGTLVPPKTEEEMNAFK